MSTQANRDEVRLLAPAKVNLLLEVLDRRGDGYHEIDSIFLPVDFCDTVTVSRDSGPAGRVRLECDDPGLPQDRENTAWRAVEEFYRGRAVRPALSIRVEKRIPSGAGLGGGSSDAAAVLRALARLEGEDERGARAREAARRVGADVPFFLWCRPSRVRGVGEVVEPVSGLPRLSLAIVWPQRTISTAWAYAELDRSLTWPRRADRIPRFLSGDRKVTELHNEFEAVIGRTYPEILELKRRLLALGATAAGMSGSGSAVFGIFPDAGAAADSAESLRREGRGAVSAVSLQEAP